jgi:hypothetical protein
MKQLHSLKLTLSRFNFKLVISLSVSIIFFLGIFLVVWELGYPLIISLIYGVITLAAALWYIICNKGMIGALPTVEQLPTTWDKQTREDFIEDLRQRRQKSKRVMLILVPMIFTFCYKILDMYLFPNFSLTSFFESLF